MQLIITLKATVESEAAAKVLTDKVVLTLPKSPEIMIVASTHGKVDAAKDNNI